MNRDREAETRFGHTRLPPEEREAMRRATRLEWLTIAYVVFAVTVVYLVLGSSQAMRAAWIEDLLAFLPPIAFLVATRVARRRPSAEHPYGFHRATGVGHLVAAVSLLTAGGYLAVDSALKLINAEHPTIGGIEIFGNVIWLGWLMVAAMSLTIVPPVLLGRAKMRHARTLHDRVLYADADMNRADWMTALAAIVGVLGIGMGLWWMDSAAALLISGSILRDGVRNSRGAVADLIDRRARTFDEGEPHPLGKRIDETLRGFDWVADARSRIRDEGHVFHIESFVVPEDERMPTLEQIEEARTTCADLDWKTQDLIIVVTRELPAQFLPGLTHEPEGEG